MQHSDTRTADRNGRASASSTSGLYKQCKCEMTSVRGAERGGEGRAGSRRIFPPQFKLQVLEAYRRDAQCRGNQRATARKFGIHRRQIQKWLQAEGALRAALLRRAPRPAPSPPPYAAGSPEAARLPSPAPPSPPAIATELEPQPEPIDLSLKRPPPPPPPPPRKPFKLFRPYLPADEAPPSPS